MSWPFRSDVATRKRSEPRLSAPQPKQPESPPFAFDASYAEKAAFDRGMDQLIAATRGPERPQRVSGAVRFRIPDPPPFSSAPHMANDADLKATYDRLANDWDISDQSRFPGGSGSWDEGMFFPGYPYLAQLTQRSEHRVIAEVLAGEMTRKWIKLGTGGDDDDGVKREKIARLNDMLDEFQVKELFYEAMCHDGHYGIGRLMIDTGDNDNEQVLDAPLIVSPATIPIGCLKGLRVIDPFWVYPLNFNAIDPLHKDFYKPSRYVVMTKRVHKTRFLTFCSRPVPPILRPAYQFGGISLAQLGKPYVDNWLRTRQAVSDLIESFSTPILSTQMGSMLAQDGQGNSLLKRVQMFNQFRNNRGLFLLNKETEEEFTNVSTPLGTLDHLQAQAQEHMSAFSRIPLVKLTGIQPSGLNASSDGEIRVFYDETNSSQEKLFARPLRKLLAIMQLSEWGVVDPDIVATFHPLWQLDDAAKATIRKTNQETASGYIQDGVLDREEERKRLADEEDGLYDALDPDDLPDEPQQAEPGDGSGGPVTGGGGGPNGSAKETDGDAGTDKPPKPAVETDDKSDNSKAASDGAFVANDKGNVNKFEEAKHKRDGDGQFATNAGTGGATLSTPVGAGPTVGHEAAKAASAAQIAEKPQTKGAAALKGMTMVGKDGKRVQADGSPLPPHIEQLKIPPGWNDVRFSDNPHAGLLAIGTDKKGRTQSIYSAEHHATQAAAKFERVQALAKQYKAIEKQNAKGMQSDNPRIRDCADCLDLIMKMGVRPGSEEGENDPKADVKAFGATTLQGEHVVHEPDGVYLKFTGKKGVQLKLKIDDPKLSQNLSHRAVVAGAGAPLFPDADDKSLLAWTHTMGDGSFKTKDFRTHLGTKTAADLVESMPAPTDAASYKRAVKKVATEVSQRLGNTPTVALQSYISPVVFAKWSMASQGVKT